MSQHSSEPALAVADLRKVYHEGRSNEVEALKGITFGVPKGSIFGLLGPNGAGKTTTIKILTTLLRPTSGSAAVMGWDVVANPLEVRKAMCAVMQESAVELYLSVRNNFRVFGRFHGLSRKESDAAADRVSELFGLEELKDTKGADLSGGQKRRVQVAKTFMVDRPVIFLDEATTGMDAFNKRATVAAIKTEAQKGRTIVLTTHLLDEAEELCQSVAIVNHGTIIASGSMRQVKSMGLKLQTVQLTFRKVSEDVVKRFRRLKPHKLESADDVISVTVKDEVEVMRVLQSARRSGLLEGFEVSSASLEDVFLELVDRKAGKIGPRRVAKGREGEKVMS